MKKRKVELDQIPAILEQAVGCISKEIESLSKKDELNADDVKNLINFTTTLREIYKDYRAEVKQLELDLKTKTKQNLLSIINAEAIEK
jgi:hypothetical protein